jgi:hypothetical protein
LQTVAWQPVLLPILISRRRRVASGVMKYDLVGTTGRGPARPEPIAPTTSAAISIITPPMPSPIWPRQCRCRRPSHRTDGVIRPPPSTHRRRRSYYSRKCRRPRPFIPPQRHGGSGAGGTCKGTLRSGADAEYQKVRVSGDPLAAVPVHVPGLTSHSATKAWWEGEGGICKGRSGALPYPAPMLGVDAAALVEALAAVLTAALVALTT